MRRSAPACRTLRAQSQFFASQKTLVWLGFLFLSKPVAYILLPQCALRFLCSSCGASRPRVARSVHSRNFLLRKKRWFGLDFCSFPNPLHTFCCRSVHSAFCAPHAALRVRVSHAPCTVAIFCFAKNCFGGDEENRTPDPLLARQVLSQLSYTPKFNLILRQNRLAVPTYCLRRFFLG